VLLSVLPVIYSSNSSVLPTAVYCHRLSLANKHSDRFVCVDTIELSCSALLCSCDPQTVVRGSIDVREFICVSVRCQRVTNNVCGGEVHPITDNAGTEGGIEVQLYSFFNPGARWSGWSTPRPGRLTPGKDPVRIVQKAGRVPGPLWTGRENLDSHQGLNPGPPSP
jgi:hypothetical protein